MRRELFTNPDRTRLLLVASIFCFAGARSALRVLLVPYGTEVLRVSRAWRAR